MGKLIIYTDNNLATSLASLTDTKLLLGSDKLDVTDTNYQLTVKSIHYEKQIYKPCELEITCSCMEKEEEKIVAQPGSNATNNKQTNPPTGGNSPANAQNSDKKITLPKALKSLFFYEKKDGTMVKAATKIDVAVAQVNTTVFYVAKNYYVHSFSLKKNVAENAKGYTVTLTCFSPDKRLTLNKYCEVYSAKRFGECIFQNVLKNRFGFTANDISYSVDRLNLLKYTVNKKTQELVQPYLVQYNESFYDFLCRVANRCGEFLYYRDGKICLGLPEGNAKALSEKAICSYPEVSEAGMFDLEVNPYSGNYVDAPTLSKDALVYNTRFTQDETLHKLTVEDGENLGWESWNFFGFFGTFLAGETLPDSFSDVIEEVAETAVKVKFVGNQVKGDYKSKYVEKFVDEFGLSTYSDDGFKFLNKLYYRIRQCEEEVKRQKVEIDFSNELPLIDLGDAVTLKDGLADQYIVTRVSGNFSDTNEISHSAEVIPMGKYALSDKISVSLLPPFSVESFIREAAPQEAIVAQADDPMYMGRVRIRYLWQTPCKEKDAAVSAIEEEPQKEEEPKEEESKEEEPKEEEPKEEKDKDEDDEEDNYALSPWIRMVVPFAGGEGSFLMTPTKGDRVMINYEEHNIDCPYVEGSLFQSEQKPNQGPIDLVKKQHLPSNPIRVIASANGHCIYFNDTPGVSDFYGNLVPPIGQVFKAVKKFTDWDKETSTMNGGITLTDANGIYEVSMSTANRSISINSPLGSVNISAFTGIEISAPNGDVKISGKNITLEAGNNIVLSSGNNILDEEPEFKTGTAKWLGSLVGSFGKAMAKYFIKEYTGVDFTKLTDVKLLRSLWEVLFKPVEGSLKIQSNRNVVMTAGDGKVCVPSSLISSVGRVGKLPSVQDLTAQKYANAKFNRYKNLLVELQDKTNEYIDAVYLVYKNLLEALNNVTNDLFDDKTSHKYIKETAKGQWLKDDKEKTYKQIITNMVNKVELKSADFITDKPADSASDAEKNAYQQAAQFLNLFIDNYNEVLKSYKILANDTKDGTKLVAALKAVSDPLKKITPKDKEELKFALPQAADFGADFLGYDFSVQATWSQPEAEENWPIEKTKKQLAIKLIKQVITSSGAFETDCQNTEDQMVENEEKWKEYAASIKVKKAAEEESTLIKFGIEAFNSFAGDFVTYDEDKGLTGPAGVQKLINWDGCAGPRALWDVSQGGNILLSNSKSFTYKLNEDSKGWTPMANPSFLVLKDYLANLFSGNALAIVE